jgi:hypothetical protein
MVFFQTEISNIYIVPGSDKNDTHYKNVQIKRNKHVSNHSERVSHNAMRNVRKSGHLKQPGGSSCDQRR